MDIRLLIPVDIKAIEVAGLDYHGTRQPKAIDIFVEGKLVKHADLAEAPGQVQRIEAGGPRDRTSGSSSRTNIRPGRWTTAAGCGCGC